MSLSKLSKCPGQQQRSGEEMGLGIYNIDVLDSEVKFVFIYDVAAMRQL